MHRPTGGALTQPTHAACRHILVAPRASSSLRMPHPTQRTRSAHRTHRIPHSSFIIHHSSFIIRRVHVHRSCVRLAIVLARRCGCSTVTPVHPFHPFQALRMLARANLLAPTPPRPAAPPQHEDSRETLAATDSAGGAAGGATSAVRGRGLTRISNWVLAALELRAQLEVADRYMTVT